MTPEEKKAALQFIGTMYGASNKLDSDIIGQSNYLKPNSHELKQRFEEILRAPVSSDAYTNPTPQAAAPIRAAAPLPTPVHNIPEKIANITIDNLTKPTTLEKSTLETLLENVVVCLQKIVKLMEEKNAKPTRKAKNIIKDKL